MIETELKIALDAAALARLRRHPALSRLRLAPRRTQELLSVYYDTPGHALAAADISLRLRRVGRRWVQTVKRRGDGIASSGLFAHEEAECPAPGGRLVLSGPDPEGAIAAVVEAADGAPLAPIFETRVQRVVERLRASNGGEVELALDEGEIRAGAASVAIREAELELAAGEVHAVFEVARELFPNGPVRFAAENKAARGYRLVRGDGEPALAPRHARTLEVEPGATVETAARDVFRDCLAQVAGNMAVVAASEDPEGPHQLRVGLRRLRTAFALFGPSLGKEAMAPLSEAARRLGSVAGELRDADVLVEEVVRHAAAGLDPDAHAALEAALQARRAAVRARVREALATPESVGFLFDLGAFVEGRGWLAPSDYAQTERLAARIADIAPAVLAKRHRKVRKLGRRIRELDAAGLHELRKELKKLRYAVDMLGPVYKEREVAPYLKSLKELQDSFGSMNDAAMAREALTGAVAPAPDDPAAQRGVGWVLGTLSVKVAADRPGLFERWNRLAAAKPFWT
jgi:inorganic triphosphatase YgiF